jgi:hypothetical protein
MLTRMTLQGPDQLGPFWELMSRYHGNQDNAGPSFDLVTRAPLVVVPLSCKDIYTQQTGAAPARSSSAELWTTWYTAATGSGRARPSRDRCDLCRLALSSGAAAAYCRYVAPDPGSYSSDTSRLQERARSFFCLTACTRPLFRAGAQ